MRFEIPDIACRIDPFAGPPGITGAFQRIAQRGPVIAPPRPVYFFLGKRIGEGSAAEEISVMALLVGPGDDIDPHSLTAGARSEGAGEFEAVNDTQGTVKP